jgi:transcriptional regulator
VYLPAHFAEDRVEVLHALMREHPFATLASRAGDGLVADHLPLQLSSDGRRLLGHVARANPLWKAAAGQEVLAIFHGPQAYVSPSWYPSKHENGKAVPTWNYVVVHASGRLTAIDDAQRLRALLDDLVDRHEGEFALPWQVPTPRPITSKRCSVPSSASRSPSPRCRANGRPARTSPLPIAPASLPA